MTLKKLCLLGAAFGALAAHPALAETDARVSTTGLTGPYIGLYGGYDWTDLDAGASSGDLRGWDGGVFAGYKLDALMRRMNGFGVGMNGAVEGFYGVSNSDDTVGGVDIEKRNEWGVSFRPGFSVIDRMTAPMGVNPYGILGYRNTRFKSVGNSKRYDGFELGLGTQLVAYGNYGVRAEYSHTWYGEENGVDPSSDNLRLGVSYHF